MTAAGKILRVLALAAACLLTACIDGHEEIWIHRDGSGRADIRYSLPAAAATFHGGEDGVRKMLGDFLAANPALVSPQLDVTTEETIVALLRELRDEGRLMLVSTHNLGSVPEFCDRVVLLKNTVLAYGPTAKVFTRENLEKAFGGVLRHFVLGGAGLHEDDDPRELSVFTDDERPLVMYGRHGEKTPQHAKDRDE